MFLRWADGGGQNSLASLRRNCAAESNQRPAPVTMQTSLQATLCGAQSGATSEPNASIRRTGGRRRRVMPAMLLGFWLAAGQMPWAEAMAQSPSAIRGTVVNGYFWLKVPTQAGWNCRLECSTNLSQWDALVANIPGTGSEFQILDPDPVTGQMTRFYRTTQFNGPTPGEPPGNPNPAAWAWVAPGTFTLGGGTNSIGQESDETPATVVVLTNGFWVSRFEVSQQEYLNLIGFNPAWFVGDTSRPVEGVSYAEAASYCTLLTTQEQAAGRLPTGYAYRLPTEAEWEYACRAGSTTEFCYGDDPAGTELGFYAWFWDNSGSTNMPAGYSYLIGGNYYATHPVGTRQMNSWGLSDLHGSVWEWCLDWYGAYPGGTVTNYCGLTNGTSRVIRGGSWNAGPGSCRSANRSAAFPDGRSSGVGFRTILAR